jgi:hypothetical protein
MRMRASSFTCAGASAGPASSVRLDELGGLSAVIVADLGVHACAV